MEKVRDTPFLNLLVLGPILIRSVNKTVFSSLLEPAVILAPV